MNWDITKEELEKIVKESVNKTEVLTKLNLLNHGGNFNTLTSYLKKYKIDTNHFTRTISRTVKIMKRELDDILVENSTYKSSNHLKNRLYKEGLKERKCEKCGQGEEWYGEKMSLILDHINGIRDDNRLENLRIICPNCNATLPTHCGKNLKKKKKEMEIKKPKKINYCNCGKAISKNAKMCKECYNKNVERKRKVARPPYAQLLKEIKELGYCGVGRKYGVSDNAIRKWQKKYENGFVV